MPRTKNIRRITNLKTMATMTPEEFFAVLQKGNLLTPAEMVQARQAAQEGDDAKMIAKRLARLELITRWQAGQLLAGRSSFYLGKYRLIELLGRGGMGSVFLGRHVTMNRLVALKIISRQVGKDPASLARFLAEARAIAALDHPNIVQAYSVDNEGDRYYIVMEYVDGLDLQRMVDEEGPLDCRLAVDYIRQAAEGLEHAHQRNMIHCDVKPSNLLVNVQGVVKILDMGLARLTHGERPEISDSQERVLGSVDYLAPEQALESGELDCRADIYSLGCTLYFLLTGHPPFPKGSLPERILKHQTQPPPRLPTSVPADLAAICAKMMAKKPANRYSSAAEVGLALAQWRPSSPSRRRIPLMKAKPLPDADEADFLGLNLDDSFRGGTADRSSGGNRFERFFEALFATPLRSSIAILALTIGLLGTLWFLNARYRQSTESVVEPATQASPAAVKTTPAPPATKPVEQPEPAPTEPPQQQGPELTLPPAKPAETKPAPAKPSETEPSPLEPAKTQPSQLEPAQPKPAQPAPPNPQPKTTPPPVEKPPPGETQIELAGAVELPPLTKEEGEQSAANREAAIGKVHLAPEAKLTVKLVGGEEIFPSGRGFYLEPDSGAPPDSAWLIIWAAEARGPLPAARRDVARLTLAGGELRFHWLEGADDEPAGYLRNCGLLISAGGCRSSCLFAGRSPSIRSASI